MPDKKIKVLEGMLEAIHQALLEPIMNGTQPAYERLIGDRVCRWLSEHPKVPTDDDVLRMCNIHPDSPEGYVPYAVIVCSEWQRRMFVAPEPGVPEEIKDLILPDIESGFFKPEIINARLEEAFRRGQKAGSK
jgi:hypothetical protein